MTDQSSLELRTVVQRFNEASSALDQLRERLQALELAEDVQGRAASSLDGSAAAIARLAAEAEEALMIVKQAAVVVEEALHKAAVFLEGTDLSGLRRSVADVQDVVSDLVGKVNAQTELVAGLHDQVAQLTELVTGDVRDARREAVEAKDALAAIEAKIAAVPDRLRRKAGF